jgi:hypothetical protein
MPSKVPGVVEKMVEELKSIFLSNKTEKVAKKTLPKASPTLTTIAPSVAKQVNEDKTPTFENRTRAADFAVLNILLNNSKSKNLCLMDVIWTLSEQGATVTKIEPVLRIDLLMDFLDEVRRMEDKRPSLSGWDIAFHGTLASNVPSIVEHGFRLPLKDGHRSRYIANWGDGIYCSPCANVSYDYGYSLNQIPSGELYIEPEKEVPIFLCIVLRGKPMECDLQYFRQYTGLVNGYDSHRWSKNSEWIVFDERRIIPLCLLGVKCGADGFETKMRVKAGVSKDITTDSFPSFREALTTSTGDEKLQSCRGTVAINERSAVYLSQYLDE